MTHAIFYSVADMPAEFWRWPHFTVREMACRCGCGEIVVVVDFMDRLEAIRKKLSRPMVVTSGYRCPDYNDQVSTTGPDGPHTTGRAADVKIFGEGALRLATLAPGLGFTGVGLKQRGIRAGRFLHLDDLAAAPGRPRPWMWTY
jgi:uncharacterized protein YcbK (DUF882 family)